MPSEEGKGCAVRDKKIDRLQRSVNLFSRNPHSLDSPYCRQAETNKTSMRHGKKRSSYENERKYTLRIETKRKLRIDRQGFAGLAGADGARDSAAYVGGNGAGTVTAPARVGLLSVRGVGVRTMFGMVPHRAVAGARLCVSDSYTRLSVCLILHIR